MKVPDLTCTEGNIADNISAFIQLLKNKFIHRGPDYWVEELKGGKDLEKKWEHVTLAYSASKVWPVTTLFVLLRVSDVSTIIFAPDNTGKP